jgi:hypothetical protein
MGHGEDGEGVYSLRTAANQVLISCESHRAGIRINLHRWTAFELDVAAILFG